MAVIVCFFGVALLTFFEYRGILLLLLNIFGTISIEWTWYELLNPWLLKKARSHASKDSNIFLTKFCSQNSLTEHFLGMLVISRELNQSQRTFVERQLGVARSWLELAH